MRIKVKGLHGWWMLILLPVASFAATSSDVRLVEAVMNGDKQAVLSMLKEHVDVNVPQADGATALAWAAHRDDLEIAELLVRAGANVNAANDYGVTPLSLACTNGSAPMVEKLLENGADPNAALPTGETPLMTAARTGNVEVVKLLLARRANANAKENQHGQTALMWALEQKHPEVARALTERGADLQARSKSGFTPLLFAAREGALDSVQMLLAAGANVNEATPDGTSPLLLASASGYEALSLFLLEKGADPNAADGDGATALHYAMLKGMSTIAAVIPDYAANSYLLRPSMTELVKRLLAHGANPNARLVKNLRLRGLGPRLSLAGATPFLVAAASFDVSLMRVLVEVGADPLLATKENTTALMVAAGLANIQNRTEEEERSALEAVKLVLELGADVNAVDDHGWTALHGAAYTGSDAIVQFLVEKGAKMDVLDKLGQSPLSIAHGVIGAKLLDFTKKPYGPHPNTANVLLKLGATPLNPEEFFGFGVQRSYDVPGRTSESSTERRSRP